MRRGKVALFLKAAHNEFIALLFIAFCGLEGFNLVFRLGTRMLTRHAVKQAMKPFVETRVAILFFFGGALLLKRLL